MKKILYIVFSLILIPLITFSLIGLFYKSSSMIRPGLKGKFIKLNHNQIRYNQKGKGKDVVLVHGSPGTIEDWELIVDDLSKHFRVTTYDRPGHGYSGNINNDFTIESNARTLFDLIDALNLRNVVVVGHSFGGSSALALAIHNPINIKSFVLLGASAYPSKKNIPFLLKLLSVPMLGKGIAVTIRPLFMPVMIREAIIKSFSPNIKSIPEGYFDLRLVLWNRAKVVISTARETVKLNKSLSQLSKKYTLITKPVFLLYGEEDAMVNKDDQLKLNQDISHTTLLPFSDTGHFIQYAHPKQLIKIIKKASQ